MSSLQLSVAATTAACQARLRNQQMASAAGAQNVVPIASTATDPCSATGVATHVIVAADIKKGAVFVMNDGHAIQIVDFDEKSGDLKYDVQNQDGTWPNDPKPDNATALRPKLIFLLQTGSS
jgi:hypothetical protein